MSSRRSEGPEGSEPQTAAEPGAADAPASTPAEERGHRSLLTDPAASDRAGEDPATGYVPTESAGRAGGHDPAPSAGDPGTAGPSDATQVLPGGLVSGDPLSAPAPFSTPGADPATHPAQPIADPAQPGAAAAPGYAAQPGSAPDAASYPAQPGAPAAPGYAGPAPDAAAYPAQPGAPARPGLAGDPVHPAQAGAIPGAAAYPAQPGVAPALGAAAYPAQPGAPVYPAYGPAPAAYPGGIVQPGAYPGVLPPQPEIVPVADLPAGLDPDELAARPVTSARRSRLRRRVAFLRAAREVLLRDLGGFIYEVHRTAHDIEHEAHRRLRETKLTRLARVDAELHEIETRLDDVRRQVLVREPGVGGECPECGELFSSWAHYCGNCGLPLTESARKDLAARTAAPEPDPVVPPTPAVAATPAVDQPTQEIPPLDPDAPSSAGAEFQWPRRHSWSGDPSTGEDATQAVGDAAPATSGGEPTPGEDAPRGDSAVAAEDASPAETSAVTPSENAPRAEATDDYVDYAAPGVTSGDPLAPADFTKAEDAPAEAPHAEAPVDAAPADEAPPAEAPAEAAPADEAPHAEAQADPAPADEAPQAEPLAGETPHAEAPQAESPADEAPHAGTPADETPHAEAQADAAPADEVSHADDEPRAGATSAEVAPRDEANAAPAEDAPRTESVPSDAAPAAEAPRAEAADDDAPNEDAPRGADRDVEDGGDSPHNGSVFSPVERRP